MYPSKCRADASLGRLFLAAQRTAALRHDDETEASLINRILRSYLQYSQYDQADKLVSKTSFPTAAGNPQHARYHYYLGRIKAVQLNYTAAHTNLQQAIRRAPPAKTAPGFYQAVHKLSIVVELLMGDIPERSLFRHPVLEKALAGYFEIVKGDYSSHGRIGPYPTFTDTILLSQRSETDRSRNSKARSRATPRSSSQTRRTRSSCACVRT